MNIVRFYSNKEVTFRFNGKNLSFFLSQALFSSYNVDSGTRLLLKTIAKKCDLSLYKSVLDIGCGTGVIGLSLKKAFPSLEVTLQDRDALAVHFTIQNSIKNDITDVKVLSDLAFRNLPCPHYDLIVSNLPAKAGIPVLEEFIDSSLLYLSDSGRGAVVIIDSLKEIIESLLKKLHAEIIHTETTKEYTVFHYQKSKNLLQYPGNQIKKTTGISPYIRNKKTFVIAQISYQIETVYNIPGFDTIPYDVSLISSAVSRFKPEGNIFIWNPGQGHIPSILLSCSTGQIDSFTLASRDILQCEISSYNIKKLQKNLPVQKKVIPSPLSIGNKETDTAQSYNCMVFNITEVTDKKLIADILNRGRDLLISGGFLLFTGKSSLFSETAREHRGYSPIFSRKFRGFRILILQKNT